MMGTLPLEQLGKTLENVMNGDEFRAYAKQLYGVVGSANYNTTALSALAQQTLIGKDKSIKQHLIMNTTSAVFRVV